MAESLEQFKNSTLSGSYANPKTGTYSGECVSYFRQGEERMFNIPSGSWGHAKDYWNNPKVLQYFTQQSTPQNGDGVVYGATPTNPYGHIGWVYNGQLLSQNANVPKRVTIVSLDYVKNRLGFLRFKGDGMTLKSNDVAELFRLWAGREPTKQELKDFTGKYLEDTTKYLRQSEAGKQVASWRDTGRKALKEKWGPTEYTEVGEVDGKKVYRRK